MQQQQAQSGEVGPAATSAPRDEAGDAPRTALLLDSDLFFAVKVTETLKHAGYTTRTVRRAEDFGAALVGERPAVALVNAGARGVDWRAGVAAAHLAGVPVVVYAPHVDVATHEEARAAGATSVIANSKLSADLPAVVARALRRVGGAAATATIADANSAADDDLSGDHDGDPDDKRHGGAVTGGTPDAGEAEVERAPAKPPTK